MKVHNIPKVIQVTQTGGSPIDTCTITILVEDTSNKKKLKAQHGLSLHLDASSQDARIKIVFDSGPSQKILSNNLKALNLKLNDLDVITVSHGHYDHTDGLPEIIRRTHFRIPVIFHPRLFAPKFAYKPNLTYIGPSYKQSSITDNAVSITNRKPLSITNGIMITGEIPLTTDFEKPHNLWKMGNEGIVPDLMIDEQALIIDVEKKGIVVVTGCAHRGIINTIRYAKKICNRRHVHAIVGGFHLSKASDKVIQSTVAELNMIDPDFLYPSHCSGAETVKMLCEHFGDRCQPVKTGDNMTFQS